MELSPRHGEGSDPRSRPTVTPSPSNKKKIIQIDFNDSSGSRKIDSNHRSVLHRAWSDESSCSILSSIDINDPVVFPDAYESKNVLPFASPSRNTFFRKPPCASRRSSAESYSFNVVLSPSTVPYASASLPSVAGNQFDTDALGSSQNEPIPRLHLGRAWSGESCCSIYTTIDSNDSVFPDAYENNTVPSPLSSFQNSCVHSDEEVPAISLMKPPCASRRSSSESYMFNVILSPSTVPYAPASPPSAVGNQLGTDALGPSQNEPTPRLRLGRAWSGESCCSIYNSIDFNGFFVFPDACENNTVPSPLSSFQNSLVHSDEKVLATALTKPPNGSRRNSVESFSFNMMPLPPMFSFPCESFKLKNDTELFQSGNSTLSTHSSAFRLTTHTTHEGRPCLPLIENDASPTVSLSQDCKPPKKKGKKNHFEGTKEKVYVDSGYHDTDVLCGKGERINRHLGHKLFHQEKKRLQGRYIQTIVRKEKAEIARELIETMVEKYQSRFLKFCHEKGLWYIISDEQALNKAKQVLREPFSAEQRKMKRLLYYKPKNKK